MSTPASKRRRVEIPASVKKQICQYKVDQPETTIQDIKSYILKETALELGKSTVSDILKMKDKWLSEKTENLRHRTPKHQKLEDAVFMWFSNMTSHHAAVNDEMLLSKAKALGEKLDVGDFNYSRGWLQRFKNRRGIKRRLYEGEADSADMTAVETGRQQLQELLKVYAPDNIYNLDETGLFFRLGPNATLATKKVQGTKKSKERLTIALAANASGTDKRRPFVIAKVNRPRCFGKSYNPETYVRYRHNQKAWMTADLFLDWLRDFDKQMSLARRSVILLLDNAASHTAGDLRLRSIHLHFLPPNTTSHIQPMDAGIIKTFKTYYRKQLIQMYIEHAEAGEPQTVNIKQALSMIKKAWDSVSARIITNCFRHVQILPTTTEQADSDDDLPLQQLRRPRPDQDDDEDDMPLHQLRRLLLQLPSESCDISAKDNVEVDMEEPTGHQLQDEDILSIVSDVPEDPINDKDDDNSDDPDNAPCADVTIKEARAGLTAAISYFEQTGAGFNNNDHQDNERFLDQLWRMVTCLQDRTIKDSCQTKVTGLF